MRSDVRGQSSGATAESENSKKVIQSEGRGAKVESKRGRERGSEKTIYGCKKKKERDRERQRTRERDKEREIKKLYADLIKNIYKKGERKGERQIIYRFTEIIYKYTERERESKTERVRERN